MKRLLLAFVFAASAAFAQVYAVTVTAGGSGYTSNPTVTATGGACTTEPTFQATIASGAVSAVSVTFAGVCTVAGAAPSIAITGGGGTGAAATAIMLQANIAILSTPVVVSDANPQVSISGTNKLYRYECTLTVPALFVPFYSSSFSIGAVLDRMPNTSQSSQVIWAAISGASALQAYYNSAFAAGILTVYDGQENVNSSTPIATVEAILVLNCATWQSDLNAWNPWISYGTFYNGSWTALGIP
jgi:hypothetical protein